MLFLRINLLLYLLDSKELNRVGEILKILLVDLHRVEVLLLKVHKEELILRRAILHRVDSRTLQHLNLIHRIHHRVVKRLLLHKILQLVELHRILSRVILQEIQLKEVLQTQQDNHKVVLSQIKEGHSRIKVVHLRRILQVHLRVVQLLKEVLQLAQHHLYLQELTLLQLQMQVQDLLLLSFQHLSLLRHSVGRCLQLLNEDRILHRKEDKILIRRRILQLHKVVQIHREYRILNIYLGDLTQKKKQRRIQLKENRQPTPVCLRLKTK